MEDREIVSMMQNVVMGGGFITNVLHNKWMRVDEDKCTACGRCATFCARDVWLMQGQVPQPDIQYEMDTETFLAITRKEISGLKASMPDMIKLQKIDKL